VVDRDVAVGPAPARKVAAEQVVAAKVALREALKGQA
jgi:hypothetical protein